jgi:hypothetical protein
MNELIKKKLQHYAKLFGIEKQIRNITESEELECEGSCLLVHNTDAVDFNFTSDKDEVIIHEVLHVLLKNTILIPMHLMTSKGYKAYTMLHEQEIDRLACKLAKLIPYKE